MDLYLEDEFLGQRESRAVLLEIEFRTLSITDYCYRLEMMATSFTELGEFCHPPQ